MLVNGVLNLAIGLALTFATISLVASAITEAIASALGSRSKTLLSGIKRLLNDQDLKGLALDVLNHAAVNPMAPGNAVAPPPGSWPWGSRNPFASLPSYIPPAGFAEALIDSIQKRNQAGGAVASLDAAIADIADIQIRTALQGFRQRAGNSIEEFHHSVASWFDASMDRLSGEYKRRAQLWNFGLALLLVILLNVDAIALAQRLYVDPAIVSHAANVGQATDYATALKGWQQSFPYGWGALKASPVAQEWHDGQWSKLGHDLGWPCVLAFPGWLLTALATLFGAPFWFDTLQRFVQLRGTGPETKAKAAAA